MNYKLFVIIIISIFIQSCRSSIPPLNKNPDFAYVSRSEWKAAAPAFPMVQHKPRFITIHHTATLQSNKLISDKLLALQNFSLSIEPLADGSPKKAWADIPYHYYLDPEGTIAEGREIEFMGDSNTAHDLDGHILIVLEGNFELEKVTPQQYQSLEKLISALAVRWKIPAKAIYGHKDQASTSCPGTDLYRLLPQLRNSLTQS